MDRIGLIIVSAGACVVMFVLLIWCLFSNLPGVGAIFEQYSKRFFNGLSLVNACKAVIQGIRSFVDHADAALAYPTIFDELTPDHIEAARRHMTTPIKQSGSSVHARVFNLDAAKLM